MQNTNKTQSVAAVNTAKAAKKTKKGMRSGFTLIEIIFVAVIIAVLAGLIIPKVLSNARTSEYLSTLQENVKSLRNAVNQFKFDGGKISSTVLTDDILTYMPSTFALTDNKTDRGVNYMKDSNDDLFEIAFEGTDNGTADVTISVANYDELAQNLKSKLIAKAKKTLNCDDGAQDDNSKTLKLTSCHF